MIKFSPNGDRVVVRPFEEKELHKAKVSIIVPFGQSKEAAQMGEVVAIGPTASYKVGDLVIFNPYAGDTLRVEVENGRFTEMRILHSDTIHSSYSDA